MLRIGTLCFCIFISFACFSQDLTGEWQGYFTSDLRYDVTSQKTSIALTINLNQDGTYSIFSFTRLKTSNGKDTTIVCKVSYKKNGKRSIILQEQKYNEHDTDDNTFQKMYLKIKERKGLPELHGRWETANGNSSGKGDIFFTKNVTKYK